MQKLWESKDVYRFDPDSPNKIYSIDTPPPTVSGSLHIGHIFSYTQAEMVARFRKFTGYNVFYPFGFDDNGLPTERLVEKEEGIKAKDLPRDVLYEKCMTTTAKYVEEFTNLWKSLGFSVDWNLRYETINERSRRISQKSFIRLAKEGKAYVKESPVLWCTECQTSIAQAELDSADIKSTFNYIYFMVDGDAVLADIEASGAHTVTLNGTEVSFGPDDLLVSTGQKEGFISAADRGITVVLETTLTPELIQKGYAREFVSKVQNLRKSSGFEVMDRIAITYESDDEFEQLLAPGLAGVAKELLADSIARAEAVEAEAFDINGKNVKILIKKN